MLAATKNWQIVALRCPFVGSVLSVFHWLGSIHVQGTDGGDWLYVSITKHQSMFNCDDLE